jgi:hypothetical protein
MHKSVLPLSSILAELIDRYTLVEVLDRLLEYIAAEAIIHKAQKAEYDSLTFFVEKALGQAVAIANTDDDKRG